jgi:hypothetical protein
LKITDTDSSGTTGAYLTKNFSPLITGDIYVRFYLFLPTGWGTANSGCQRRIVRVYNSDSSYTVISLTADGLALAEVGKWGGTGGPTLSENAWHCVELHIAPPSASTLIEYWVDGTSAGTCTANFSASSTFNYMQLGDVAMASGQNNNGTGTFYWDQVVVSNFYNGPVASPSAPPAVRDGTGADIATTGSTTQLSANWDAATDAESGISGYQYAIGTTAGGTQTLNWTSLGNVTTVTKTGLTLTAGQTYYFSVKAVNGAGLTGNATNSNGQTVAPPQIVGRYVFYNNCKWDAHDAFTNGDPAANQWDDAAIATDKSALLSGHTATFANYTNYLKGLNGIMIDISGLNGYVPTAADFRFQVGNTTNPAPSSWGAAPTPTAIVVRQGGGVGGSDRVDITWADNAIQNQWLEVTVLAGNLGLTANDVFCFGNQIGDTGNSPTDTRTDALDTSAVQAHYSGFSSVSVTNPYDINRDKSVDALDFSAVQAHYTGFGSSLILLSLP